MFLKRTSTVITLIQDPKLSKNRFSGPKAVQKPVISANAEDTKLIDTKTLMEAQISTPYLIQEFVPQIASNGEMSLFYFDGEYSHAFCKWPKASDFRVQQKHGKVYLYQSNYDTVLSIRTYYERTYSDKPD